MPNIERVTWNGLLNGQRALRADLRLTATLKPSTEGGSGAFLGLADDKQHYWIKTLNNAQGKGLGDWLGTGMIASQARQFRPFKEARAYVRGLGLKNQKEWAAFTRSEDRPPDIPSLPSQTYGDKGWVSLGDWLGTGTIATRQRKYRRFEEALAYVRSLGIKNWEEWRAFSRSEDRPADIPSDPRSVYRDRGWKGLGDWLGTGRTRDRNWRPFKEARAYVRGRGFTNKHDWEAFARSEERPPDIPSNPNLAYRNKGWKGMGDWIGTGTIALQQRVYLPFEEARAYVRGLGLTSAREWKAFARSEDRPADIPSHSDESYRDKGWAGMADWLGTDQKPAKKRRSR